MKKPISKRNTSSHKSNKSRAHFSKPHQSKGGKSQSKQSINKHPVDQENDEDDDDDNDDFLSFNKRKNQDSDEESEEEIFNISTKKGNKNKDSDEDSDKEDEEDDEEEDDDDDDGDYDEDEYEKLNQLVHNLPADLKRGILHGKASMQEGEDEDEDEEETAQDKRWGKKKTYWTGDTADLEIGQEIEDAYAEEEAAKELQQQKLKRMKKKDFYDNLEEEEESEEGEEEDDDAAEDENKNMDLLGNRLSQKNKTKQVSQLHSSKKSSSKDKITKELEAIVVGSSGDLNEVQTEQLAKDISGFTKEQKLELLSTHAPELINIVRELRERIEELQHKIEPIKKLLAQAKELKAEVDDDLVDYVEVKQQLLLSYCLNVVFYLSMKTEGKSVRNHPVMKQLLKLRYAMEKMHSLDSKLKHQLDRLLKLAESNPAADEIKAGLLRPNLSSFLSNDDEEEDDETGAYRKKSKKKTSKKRYSDEDDSRMDEEEDIEDGSDDNEEQEEDDFSDDEEDSRNNKRSRRMTSDDDDEDGDVYRPPKLSSTPYPDDRALEKQDRQLEKKRLKLKNSELMDSLREEFGTAPEVSTSTGTANISGDLKKLEQEQAERIKFEEERFVRMTVTRKEKKEMKKRLREANRLDNFDDIGDYEDLEELSKLIVPSSSSSSNPATASAHNSSIASTKALTKAMAMFQGKEKKKGSSALDLLAAEFGNNGHDEEDGDYPKHKRRKAPAPDEEMDDGEENVFDDFIDKKKQFLAKKKEHYTAEPRFGGVEETVGENDKRAISYEIMKNRGLTAHKSKLNRNPRVKKREAYKKAVQNRKGQVRDVIKGVEDSYGGELSGIKSNLSRSRKMHS